MRSVGSAPSVRLQRGAGEEGKSQYSGATSSYISKGAVEAATGSALNPFPTCSEVKVSDGADVGGTAAAAAMAATPSIRL